MVHVHHFSDHSAGETGLAGCLLDLFSSSTSSKNALWDIFVPCFMGRILQAECPSVTQPTLSKH